MSGRIGAHDEPRAQLFVVMERSRPLAGGARHSLSNIQRATVGRGEARIARRVVEDGRPTLRLSVPDEQMSATHAGFESRSGEWVIQDYGSTNGTRVNGRRTKRRPCPTETSWSWGGPTSAFGGP